ncbi:MAG: hypothetical protein IT323_05965, partial [Anaerolineae bacterium]|nr:hypothetical protein [Anaerolineae bacterium]
MSGAPAGNHDVIDRFMHTLRHDPDAPTPPGLDAQTADFVRQLVQAEKAPARLEPDQHARIWDKALRMAQTSADLSRLRPGPGRIVRRFTRSGDSPMLVS